MDRYLLSGAVCALLLQLFLLLADVGIIEVSFWQKSAPTTGTRVIGTLVEKRANVKRKAASSIVWEDSAKDDRLYSFDSILTLDHSSARITLEGDIKINLQENTLVMLEPIESDSNDPLKIRFNYGQFSSRSAAGARSRTLKVGTGEWSVEAKPGAELSLQSLEGDQVQVEVHAGEVSLKKSNEQLIEKLEEGARVILDKEEVAAREKLDEESMKFVFSEGQIQGNTQRVYTHTFPHRYQLRWQGEAQELRVILPDRRVEHLPLSEGEREKTLPLWGGAYSFSLVKSDQAGNTISSETLHLSILPAPKIRYTSPLPRERVIVKENTDLAWFKLPDIQRYRVEVITPPKQGDMATLYWSADVSQPSTTWQPQTTGRYFWQVYGIDPDGFEIPPHYANEIFSVFNPLSAPRLRAPAKTDDESTLKPNEIDREKKSDDQNKKSSTGAFHRVWELFFAKAYAQEIGASAGDEKKSDGASEGVNATNKSSQTQPSRQLIFSWYPVEDADFYIIEISSTPDFLQPEVNQKISSPEFIWREFKNEVYYWRVAAGQNNGRMGLFSEVGTLDVRKLKALKAGELMPGVKYIPENPVIKPTQAPEPTPTPTPQPTPPPEPPPKPIDPTAPLRLEVWGGASYHSSRYKSDDIKSSFTGSSDGLIGFSVGAGDPRGWRLHVQYELSTYVPKNKNVIPYQPEEKVGRTDAHFFLPSSRYRHWALMFSQKPSYQRTGMESISVEAQSFYGVGYSYDFLRTPSEAHVINGSLFLSRGRHDTAADLAFYHEFTFNPNHLTTPLMREEIRYETFFGNSTYTDLSLRIYFGWRW